MSDRKYCGSKAKHGGTCQNPAGFKTQHPGIGKCHLHFGNSENHRHHAEIEKAKQAAAVMGRPNPVDPFNAILQALATVNGEITYATLKINELTDALDEPTQTHIRPLNLGKDGEDPENPVTEVRIETAELHVWITTRQEAMDRLVKYSTAALKAGIDERLVKINEHQAQLVATMVFGILSDLHIPNDKRTLTVVRERLLELDAGPVSAEAMVF